MDRSLFLLAAALLVGCDAAPPVATSNAPLRAAPSWIAGAEVIDSRGSLRILAGPAPRAPEQTDLRPARPLALDDGGQFVDPPAPSWTGRLTAKGALWITVGEKLVDQAGNTLDEEVSPELAVSADGQQVAYTKGFPNGVYVRDLRDGHVRHATAAMHDANQPIFHGANRLIVAGSATTEVYGIWVVDLVEGAKPRAITNGDLKVGQGLGPSFVPPPARHESMKLVGDTLVYFDGEGERRVVVGAPR